MTDRLGEIEEVPPFAGREKVSDDSSVGSSRDSSVGSSRVDSWLSSDVIHPFAVSSFGKRSSSSGQSSNEVDGVPVQSSMAAMNFRYVRRSFFQPEGR